ncbi:MAG TPA: potassium/proton antiporter [Nocardioidaceae bacterium]|nr:potassium/proton antiporter [Nocardioidaceae bacterium]
MDIEQLDTYLLVGSGVLLAAVVAVRASLRVGLPSLLFYLFIGVLLGESVIGINFEDAELAHALGFGALVVILAEGGLTTRWSEVRHSVGLGALLATAGIAVSTVVVAGFAHLALGLGWELAILLGAVTAPTDSAAVFSVLRRVPLPRHLTGVLEAESGLNDAPTVLLVTLLSTGAVAEHGTAELAGIIVMELVGGIAFGLTVGFGGAWVLRRVALPSSGLYPITVLSFTIFAYAGAAALHLSGFAAVYVAALVLGNSELPHRLPTRSFAEGMAWLAQIGLFVMLGLLASPGEVTLRLVLAGLATGAVLTFVARPLSVWLCALPSRMGLREQAFIGWAGLRGAVPIVLATIPLSQEFANADDLFTLVFVLVVVYTVLQGPTLPWVAERLRVSTAGRPQEVEVEAAPLDRLSADLLQVRIPPGSRLHGVEIGELRLPVGASLSLVVRQGESFVPDRRDVLRTGDDLLVVTPRRSRDTTEERLREIDRAGRLAGWLVDRPRRQR